VLYVLLSRLLKRGVTDIGVAEEERSVEEVRG